jgi:uracil-DNA glycosylase
LRGAEWVKNRTITEIFSHIGSEIYTTEVYKCHVDKKDKKCLKYLEKELKEILNLELIIAAGGSASRHVLKTFGKKHKKLGQIEELKISIKRSFSCLLFILPSKRGDVWESKTTVNILVSASAILVINNKRYEIA